MGSGFHTAPIALECDQIRQTTSGFSLGRVMNGIQPEINANRVYT